MGDSLLTAGNLVAVDVGGVASQSPSHGGLTSHTINPEADTGVAPFESQSPSHGGLTSHSVLFSWPLWSGCGSQSPSHGGLTSHINSVWLDPSYHLYVIVSIPFSWGTHFSPCKKASSQGFVPVRLNPLLMGDSLLTRVHRCGLELLAWSWSQSPSHGGLTSHVMPLVWLPLQYKTAVSIPFSWGTHFSLEPISPEQSRVLESQSPSHGGLTSHLIFEVPDKAAEQVSIPFSWGTHFSHRLGR